MSIITVNFDLTPISSQKIRLNLEKNTLICDVVTALNDRININKDLLENFGLLMINDFDMSSKIWLSPQKTILHYNIEDDCILYYISKIIEVTMSVASNIHKRITLDSSLSMTEQIDHIGSIFGISNYEEYGIIKEYETKKVKYDGGLMKTMNKKMLKYQQKEEKALEALQKQLKTDDSVAWIEMSKSLSSINIEAGDVLMLRRRYFYNDLKKNDNNLEENEIIYNEIKDDIVKSRMLIIFKDAIYLAALQIIADVQDEALLQNKKQRYDLINMILPEEYRKEKSVYKQILKVHGNNSSLECVDAKIQYIKYCQTLKTYGFTFFLVQEITNRKTTQMVQFGISKSDVLILKPTTKEVIRNWHLSNIRNYGSSSDSFTMDLGEHEPIYTVKSAECLKIKSLISGYIDLYLKKKQKIVIRPVVGKSIKTANVSQGKSNHGVMVKQLPKPTLPKIVVSQSHAVSISDNPVIFKERKYDSSGNPDSQNIEYDLNNVYQGKIASITSDNITNFQKYVENINNNVNQYIQFFETAEIPYALTQIRTVLGGIIGTVANLVMFQSEEKCDEMISLTDLNADVEELNRLTSKMPKNYPNSIELENTEYNYPSKIRRKNGLFDMSRDLIENLGLLLKSTDQKDKNKFIDNVARYTHKMLDEIDCNNIQNGFTGRNYLSKNIKNNSKDLIENVLTLKNLEIYFTPKQQEAKMEFLQMCDSLNQKITEADRVGLLFVMSPNNQQLADKFKSIINKSLIELESLRKIAQDSGILKSDKDANEFFQKCYDCIEQFNNILDADNIDIDGIEDYIYNNRSYDIYKKSSKLLGAMSLMMLTDIDKSRNEDLNDLMAELNVAIVEEKPISQVELILKKISNSLFSLHECNVTLDGIHSMKSIPEVEVLFSNIRRCFNQDMDKYVTDSKVYNQHKIKIEDLMKQYATLSQIDNFEADDLQKIYNNIILIRKEIEKMMINVKPKSQKLNATDIMAYECIDRIVEANKNLTPITNMLDNIIQSSVIYRVPLLNADYRQYCKVHKMVDERLKNYCKKKVSSSGVNNNAEEINCYSNIMLNELTNLVHSCNTLILPNPMFEKNNDQISYMHAANNQIVNNIQNLAESAGQLYNCGISAEIFNPISKLNDSFKNLFNLTRKSKPDGKSVNENIKKIAEIYQICESAIKELIKYTSPPLETHVIFSREMVKNAVKLSKIADEIIVQTEKMNKVDEKTSEEVQLLANSATKLILSTKLFGLTNSNNTGRDNVIGTIKNMMEPAINLINMARVNDNHNENIDKLEENLTNAASASLKFLWAGPTNITDQERKIYEIVNKCEFVGQMSLSDDNFYSSLDKIILANASLMKGKDSSKSKINMSHIKKLDELLKKVKNSDENSLAKNLAELDQHFLLIRTNLMSNGGLSRLVECILNTNYSLYAMSNLFLHIKEQNISKNLQFDEKYLNHVKKINYYVNQSLQFKFGNDEKFLILCIDAAEKLIQECGDMERFCHVVLAKYPDYHIIDSVLTEKREMIANVVDLKTLLRETLSLKVTNTNQIEKSLTQLEYVKHKLSRPFINETVKKNNILNESDLKSLQMEEMDAFDSNLSKNVTNAENNFNTLYQALSINDKTTVNNSISDCVNSVMDISFTLDDLPYVDDNYTKKKYLFNKYADTVDVTCNLLKKIDHGISNVENVKDFQKVSKTLDECISILPKISCLNKAISELKNPNLKRLSDVPIESTSKEMYNNKYDNSVKALSDSAHDLVSKIKQTPFDGESFKEYTNGFTKAYARFVKLVFDVKKAAEKDTEVLNEKKKLEESSIAFLNILKCSSNGVTSLKQKNEIEASKKSIFVSAHRIIKLSKMSSNKSCLKTLDNVISNMNHGLSQIVLEPKNSLTYQSSVENVTKFNLPVLQECLKELAIKPNDLTILKMTTCCENLGNNLQQCLYTRAISDLAKNRFGMMTSASNEYFQSNQSNVAYTTSKKYYIIRKLNSYVAKLYQLESMLISPNSHQSDTDIMKKVNIICDEMIQFNKDIVNNNDVDNVETFESVIKDVDELTLDFYRNNKIGDKEEKFQINVSYVKRLIEKSENLILSLNSNDGNNIQLIPKSEFDMGNVKEIQKVDCQNAIKLFSVMENVCENLSSNNNSNIKQNNVQISEITEQMCLDLNSNIPGLNDVDNIQLKIMGYSKQLKNSKLNSNSKSKIDLSNPINQKICQERVLYLCKEFNRLSNGLWNNIYCKNYDTITYYAHSFDNIAKNFAKDVQEMANCISNKNEPKYERNLKLKGSELLDEAANLIQKLKNYLKCNPTDKPLSIDKFSDFIEEMLSVHGESLSNDVKVSLLKDNLRDTVMDIDNKPTDFKQEGYGFNISDLDKITGDIVPESRKKIGNKENLYQLGLKLTKALTKLTIPNTDSEKENVHHEVSKTIKDMVKLNNIQMYNATKDEKYKGHLYTSQKLHEIAKQTIDVIDEASIKPIQQNLVENVFQTRLDDEVIKLSSTIADYCSTMRHTSERKHLGADALNSIKIATSDIETSTMFAEAGANISNYIENCDEQLVECRKSFADLTKNLVLSIKNFIANIDNPEKEVVVLISEIAKNTVDIVKHVKLSAQCLSQKNMKSKEIELFKCSLDLLNVIQKIINVKWNLGSSLDNKLKKNYKENLMEYSKSLVAHIQSIFTIIKSAYVKNEESTTKRIKLLKAIDIHIESIKNSANEKMDQNSFDASLLTNLIISVRNVSDMINDGIILAIESKWNEFEITLEKSLDTMNEIVGMIKSLIIALEKKYRPKISEASILLIKSLAKVYEINIKYDDYDVKSNINDSIKIFLQVITEISPKLRRNIYENKTSNLSNTGIFSQAYKELEIANKKINDLTVEAKKVTNKNKNVINETEITLDSTRHIVQSVEGLLEAASKAQVELEEQGRVKGTDVSTGAHNLNQWSQGLISAAVNVAENMRMLVESIHTSIKNDRSLDAVISHSRAVAAATSQMNIACQVKIDQFSENGKFVNAASLNVKRLTDLMVVHATSTMKSKKTENTNDQGSISSFHSKKEIIDAQSEMLRKERELDDARAKLSNLRRQLYHE
ncbi:hypothetical protein A3Q56_01927 [Intoshia linei]|uniref:FERM domain-containing protein n=1 Tax=Intoshia linei TaxID=1819745 RepID=A0A177B9S4_9BILA|nr:hypothetical protein A3Q56_01927 [Intoshia linei]